jgi:hypothetical protein
MTDGTLGAKELVHSSSVGYSADSVLVPHASMHVSKLEHTVCAGVTAVLMTAVAATNMLQLHC